MLNTLDPLFVHQQINDCLDDFDAQGLLDDYDMTQADLFQVVDAEFEHGDVDANALILVLTDYQAQIELDIALPMAYRNSLSLVLNQLKYQLAA